MSAKQTPEEEMQFYLALWPKFPEYGNGPLQVYHCIKLDRRIQ